MIHPYLMLLITVDLLVLCLARAVLAWLALEEIDRLLSQLET